MDSSASSGPSPQATRIAIISDILERTTNASEAGNGQSREKDILVNRSGGKAVQNYTNQLFLVKAKYITMLIHAIIHCCTDKEIKER